MPNLAANRSRADASVDSSAVSSNLLVFLFGVAIVVGVLLLDSFRGFDTGQTQSALAIIGLAHCVFGFWQDGGKRISVPGIVLFGTGLFSYYPAIYLAMNPSARHGWTPLVVATLAILLCQLVIYHFVWAPRPEARFDGMNLRPEDRSPWIFPTGVALVVAGVGIELASGSALGDAAAYTGIILLAVGIAWSPRRMFIGYVLLAGAFIAYLELVFTGFGRLRLGSLGLAVACVLAWRWRGKLAKIFVVAAIVPALAYMAADRVAFSAERAGQPTGANGLESVVGPMARFGQLTEMLQAGKLDLSWGSTFFASGVALVPRDLWEDKPDGFGTVLARIFSPDLVAYGHSDLALLHGELIFNFGFPGLLMTLFFLGWFVKYLDRQMVSLGTRDGAGTFRFALLVTLVVVLAASMVDLIWGGTFTFVSRVGLRVLILGMMALIASIFIAIGRRQSRNTFGLMYTIDPTTRRLVKNRPAVGPSRRSDDRAYGVHPGGSTPPDGLI